MIRDNNSSDLMRALELLHNPENIEANTILTNKQVIALSVINYLSQAYDVEFYKVFMRNFPRYRISGDDGRGRKEMIEIANAIRRDKEEEPPVNPANEERDKQSRKIRCHQVRQRIEPAGLGKIKACDCRDQVERGHNDRHSNQKMCQLGCNVCRIGPAVAAAQLSLSLATPDHVHNCDNRMAV
jgi:hypothetical protein